ncbi:MAG: adenylyl-sulfate kinase [Verrucomicrobiales bacterium]|nr:adenylyl-sulfate kinase [Verrucomicrobiales bacterium]
MAGEVKSADLEWSGGEVTHELRAQHHGHRGAVLWLTGLSGSGKSTLAVALEKSLLQRGRAAYILDGDNIRYGLCADLDFSLADRAENIRRVGEVAKLMADAGLIVISALISPLQAERDHIRQQCHNEGLPFAEIYINAPLAVCEQRDPKNLYRKARAGHLKDFTGLDSPYDPPPAPELELPTDREPKETSLAKLLDLALTISASDTPPLTGPFTPVI